MKTAYTLKPLSSKHLDNWCYYDLETRFICYSHKLVNLPQIEVISEFNLEIVRPVLEKEQLSSKEICMEL